jgi:hypothetical protein
MCGSCIRKWGVIRVYNLESGHFMFELCGKGAGNIGSIVVTNEGCGVH